MYTTRLSRHRGTARLTLRKITLAFLDALPGDTLIIEHTAAHVITLTHAKHWRHQPKPSKRKQ